MRTEPAKKRSPYGEPTFEPPLGGGVTVTILDHKPRASPRLRHRLRTWARLLVAPVLIFVFSLSWFQMDVDHPPRIVSDEEFYVKAARSFTNGVFLEPSDAEGLRPENYVHPPLGKLIIAGGLLIAGKPHNEYIDDPNPSAANQHYMVGTSGESCGYYNPRCASYARIWRTPSTVFGALGVVAAYFIGWGLFGRREAGWAVVAALHLDTMYYFQARIANLETFLAAFSLMAIAFALHRSIVSRVLAALSFGAAIATKNAAIFLLLPFLILLFIRSPVPRQGARRAWMQRVGATLFYGLVLPALTYVAAHIPILRAWEAVGGWGYANSQFWRIQVAATKFHRTAEFDHFHSSQAIEWIPMIRPMRVWTLYFGDDVSNIYFIGNPWIWWTAAILLAVVPIRLLIANLRSPLPFYGHRATWRSWAQRSFPFSNDLYVGLAALLFWAAYAPFLLVDRTMFIYYMGFIVPFLAIFTGGMASLLWSRDPGSRMIVLAYYLVAVVVFLFYLPIVTGEAIAPSRHDFIIRLVPWMSSP